MMVGLGSRVDTAGAPVSPRMSAPRVPDFRRGRGIPSLDLALLLSSLGVLDDSTSMKC